MTQAFHLTVDSEGFAELVFDLPGEKVNKFNSSSMKELEHILDDLHKRSDVRILTLKSAKAGIFIAGADIEELKVIEGREEAYQKSRIGHRVFQKLESLPFPTIAAVDGACLGGGLECALACTYRLATDDVKTSLGLPEVNLGIIPGWGGTARLPRLIGYEQSLKMILAGKALPAKKALKIKLVDRVCAREFLPEESRKFAEECLTNATGILRNRERGGWRTLLLEGNLFGKKLLFDQSRKSVLKKSKGHYPAPLAALKVIESTQNASLQNALEAEAQAFADLAITSTCKNLIRLFFLNEALKKETWSIQEEPLAVRKSAVLGAGTMGGGIAWLMSHYRVPVRMKDVSWDAVAKGYEAAEKVYGQLQKIRKIKASEAKVKMHSITGTVDYTGFRDVDFVVEAIVENLDIKKKVLQELEREVREDTVIGSNTSSLSITEMASALQRPERFCGLHFFNPVNRMPLVEVVAGKETSPQTIATAVALMKKTKKTPVVVADCAGFLVNRILIPYLNECARMFGEGTDYQRIDRIVESFGMPMGPFVLADEVGIDVGAKAAKGLEEAYGSRMEVPQILNILVERKLYGKKNGKGFYLHHGKSREPNQDVYALPSKGDAGQIRDEEILDRAILIMVNEAGRCLEEGVVANEDYLDMAMIMGTGFPPFLGGVMGYARKLGFRTVQEKLQRLAEHRGERFAPAPYFSQEEQKEILT